MSNSKENPSGCGSYADAFNYLGVKPEEGKIGIISAFRRLAKHCHSDKGGSDEEFNTLIKAKEKALEYYQQKQQVVNEVKPQNFSDLFTHHTTQSNDSFEDGNDEKEKPAEHNQFFTFESDGDRLKKLKINYKEYLENKLTNISADTTPEKILADVFGNAANNLDILKKGVELQKKAGTLEKFNTVFWYANRVNRRFGNLSALTTLETAEIFLMSKSAEQMIDAGSYCLSFIDNNFRNSILLTDRRTNHYINLFQKMFKILANDNTAENKKSFDSALNCASQFIFNAKRGRYFDNDVARRNLEKTKIFSLLIKDKANIQERINSINSIFSSISGDYPYTGGIRLVRKNWDVKLKSVLNYIDYLKKNKGYTAQHGLSLLDITAVIQSSSEIRITGLHFTDDLINFIKQIEDNILLQDLEKDQDGRECLVIQFIKTLKIGSRGYVNDRFNEAIIEWSEVLKEPFELFKNKKELFNSLMSAFRELGADFDASGENKALNPIKGIKVPVKTAGCGAIKIIGTNDREQALKVITKLKTLFAESKAIFDKKRQFDNQDKTNSLFTKIKRRRETRNKLLPSDLDELLKICLLDL